MAAALPNKFSFGPHRCRNGLLIGDLGFAYLRRHLKLTKQSAYQDFKMKLTHTRNNGLFRLRIKLYFKSRVLFSQPLQGLIKLVSVSLSFRFDSDGEHWLGETNRLKKHRV
ncbi:hypothetical protein ES708_29037 [subsurface metagenome]